MRRPIQSVGFVTIKKTMTTTGTAIASPTPTPVERREALELRGSRRSTPRSA
jgi:hypothetical protein